MPERLAPDAMRPNPVPLEVARREATPEKFLPYSRHVNEAMVALDSGDIMLTFEMQGRAFETADVRDLNAWPTKLNAMLRSSKARRVWKECVRTCRSRWPAYTKKKQI